MQVEQWPIERPIPYVRNARVIPQQAIDKVAGSIKEFGWQQPIVVDGEGVIIVGHTRLLAAQKLGLAEVPVHVAADLTPAQVKAYRLADNRVSMETSFDHELLALELEELSTLDVDLLTTGFSDAEIDQLLQGPDMPEDSGTTFGMGGGVNDGGSGPDEGGTTTKGNAAGTQVVVGTYRVSVTRQQFEQWQDEMRQAVGFDDASVKAEMLRRLGIGGL